ncbi:MAG TPA: PglZ domain-containing protein [Bacteroidales bacterium]|nr:PglZ domain-containing protein [Bacteroidales bacterium]
MSNKFRVLWVDDEIDLLTPYFQFLNGKGYELSSVSNGNDAIELIRNQVFDLVLLDENMPGMSGLQVVDEIKKIKPQLPIIMVTKSEEENIMDSAIGSNIADYLIKPVNPNQLLLAIKKVFDKVKLVSEKSLQLYQSEFNKLSQQITFADNIDDWKNIYKNIIYFENQLEQTDNDSMLGVLQAQRIESNHSFCKYIKNNYVQWFSDTKSSLPLNSANLLSKKYFPLLKSEPKMALILIDNLRFDHWEAISKFFYNDFNIESDLYLSILPTTTSYARNALFAGLMPSEIEKIFPEIWKNDDDEGLKNLYEEELMKKQCLRLGVSDSFFFKKIIANNDGRNFSENIHNTIQKYNHGVVIYNFIDILSHSQTESRTMRELANSDESYRSLVVSWFEHSPLFEIMKKLAEEKYTLFVTTDHGSIRVEKPIKVIGERNLNTNLRYKQGRNMNYNPKEVFEIKDPAKVYLPKSMVTSSYIFATQNDFFAYPNNYSQYVGMYRNTFQHGGVSMDEMLVPYAILKTKQ